MTLENCQRIGRGVKNGMDNVSPAGFFTGLRFVVVETNDT
jgi:hypothetical protein